MIALPLLSEIVHGLAFHSLLMSFHINQVSQSYPESLFWTLFSSVPQQEFAIQNITLEVNSEVMVILGASLSGKSTILHVMSGQDESPISGSISWKPPAIQPIYLQQGKSQYAYESSK
jgi:ABC-type nitrate/sulfonate/bicarbonate transport system ATPase subunit